MLMLLQGFNCVLREIWGNIHDPVIMMLSISCK